MCRDPTLRWGSYLQQVVYLFPCAADESALFGNALIDFREVKESRIVILSGDESAVAEFAHEHLNGFNVSFPPLNSTRKALAKEKKNCNCKTCFCNCQIFMLSRQILFSIQTEHASPQCVQKS